MFWIFCFPFPKTLFINFFSMFWILFFTFSEWLSVNFSDLFWILNFLSSWWLFCNFLYVIWVLCFPFPFRPFVNFSYAFWVGHFPFCDSLVLFLPNCFSIVVPLHRMLILSFSKICISSSLSHVFFHVTSISSALFMFINFFFNYTLITRFIVRNPTFSLFYCRNIMSFTYVCNVNVCVFPCHIHCLNNSNRSKSFKWFGNMNWQI